MSSILSKIGIKTAVEERNNFDLSCAHYTTSSFFQPRVVYMHECVPGEKISIDCRTLTRLNPMVRPMMGDVKIHNRAFWVRMPNIMQYWNEFIADTPVTNSASSLKMIPSVPHFKEKDLVDVLANEYAFPAMISEGEAYDFFTSDQTYNFTPEGRTIYSILCGLGYNLHFNLDGPKVVGINYNALPLLAFCKIWQDWYTNQEWPNWNIADVYTSEKWSFAGNELTYSDLASLLGSIVVSFEKDFFTSANLHPIGSNNSSLDSTITIKDMTVDSSLKTQVTNAVTQNGTPTLQSINGTTVSAGPANFSQFIDTALHKITDYVKRHQLAGAQAFNRILGEYGVALSDIETRRTSYLGDSVVDVNISDVEQTSPTTDLGALGQLGGKGVGFGSRKFDLKTDEFGYLMIVQTIVPRFSRASGVDPLVLRRNRFDFFTPEVESLGTEPIPFSLLKNDFTDENSDEVNPDSIFGYTSRYGTYKCAVSDKITGDFHLGTRNQNMKGWILQQNFDDTLTNNYKTISREFQTAYNNKLNNMFAVSPSVSDGFILANYFSVKASLPMKKLFDDYEWSDEDAKEVNISKGGVSLT